MRHFNTVLFGLLASMVVAGCNGAADPDTTSSDPTTVETSAKNVSMSLTAQGESDASVKLHVFVKATHEEIFQQSFQVKGGSTTFLQLDVPASEYTFQVDAFADVEQTTSIGTSSSDASVDTEHMTEISLVINTEIKGSGGIQISSNEAPTIGDFSAKTNVSVDIAAEIHVDASDSDSKSLHYFWTGFGIDGTIEGSSTLTISAAAAAADKGGDHHVTVIVQDELGASAHASLNVSLDLTASGDTGADTGSDGNTDGNASTDDSAAIQLCLEVHAGCTASCKLDASTSLSGAALLVTCMAQCGIELATCENK
jgi:hypothetical protein